MSSKTNTPSKYSGKRTRNEGDDHAEGTGKQGFASMSKDRVKEIASKGGRASAGSGKNQRDHDESDDDHHADSRTAHHDESDDDHHTDGRRNNGKQGGGKQGFASMSKDRVREIASKGGRTLHKGEGPHDESDDDHDDHNTDGRRNNGKQGSGKQGFASMSKDRVKEIASKGGRTLHKGEAPHDEEDDDDTHSRNRSSTPNKQRSNGGNQGSGRKSNSTTPSSGRKRHADSDAEDHDDDHIDTHGNFATMDKDELRKIAAKGGRNSHKHDHDHDDEDRATPKNSSTPSRSGNNNKSGNTPNSGRKRKAETSDVEDDDDDHIDTHGNFATMDKDELKKVAAKGGRTNHAHKKAHTQAN